MTLDWTGWWSGYHTGPPSVDTELDNNHILQSLSAQLEITSACTFLVNFSVHGVYYTRKRWLPLHTHMHTHAHTHLQLLEWIQRTLPWLQDRMPDNTLQDTQARLEEFRQYASATKPPKTDEKARLETHFHTLQVSWVTALCGREMFLFPLCLSLSLSLSPSPSLSFRLSSV